MNIKPAAEVLYQEVSGETVLLDLKNEVYFGLDPVGTRIWQLINEGHAVGTILDTMLGEYDVSRETLEKDLKDLLTQLTDKDLIEFAGS